MTTNHYKRPSGYANSTNKLVTGPARKYIVNNGYINGYSVNMVSPTTALPARVGPRFAVLPLS